MHPLVKQLLLLLLLAAIAISALLLHGLRSDRYGLASLILGREAADPATTPITLPEHPPLEETDVPLLSRLNQEYAKLTAAVIPSVVGIHAVQTVEVRGALQGKRQFERPLGSGVIATSEGHIITNHHVVTGNQRLRITCIMPNGRRQVFDAEHLGSIVSYDIAVLRLVAPPGMRFPALKFGDSSRVQAGQIVFAVGNPFGLSESVTKGIISALDRRMSDTGPSYFQADTPINPGNSGGPLINHRGEVIGINTAVLQRSGSAATPQGIGFAIPSNEAWDAFLLITGRERAPSGYLGIATMDMTAFAAARLGLPEPRGVLIEEVVPGGPAEQAGLRPYDVVLSMNGQALRSNSQFIEMIRALPPGTTAVIDVWRNQAPIALTARIGDASMLPDLPSDEATDLSLGSPEQPPTAIPERDPASHAILQTVGIRVTPGSRGLMVDSIRPGSLAESRIQVGDRITAVNSADVDSPAAFNRALIAAAGEAEIKIKLIRDDQPLTIILGF